MKSIIASVATVAAGTLLSLAGCAEETPDTRYVDAEDDARTPAAPAAAPSAPPSAPTGEEGPEAEGRPAAVAVAGVLFTPPAAWTSVQPGSAMRKAEFVVGEPGGANAAEVAVFHFGPGQGGDAEANLARWARQVLDAQGEPVMPEIRELEGQALTKIVAVYVGEYQSGMPGQEREPRPGWMLLGGIVEGGPEGSIFVRLTGPAEAVEPHVDGFEAFIRSARPAP